MKLAESYRPDIDGLRGIAVIAVILFHAFPDLFPGGFVGVDVFFVISGYLITHIILSGMDSHTFGFGVFYARRARRIFPALIAILAACLLMGWMVMTPGEYKIFGLHIFASSIFIENFLLWFETGYFDTAAALKPLLHLWSLSVEEQFYIVFPLLIWTVKKYRLNFLLIFSVLIVLSLSVNFIFLTQESNRVFYLLHSRFWELSVGAVLAYRHLYKIGAGINQAAPGVLLILATLVVGGHVKENYLIASWLAAVCGACLIIFSDPESWINKHILSGKVIVFVGLISYPLYLWHWPLLSFFRLAEASNSISLLPKLLAITTSFVLAVITYLWIEKPLRYGRAVKHKIPLLVCGLIMTGALGVYIFIKDGLPTRYPERLSAVASYQFDYDANTNARRGQCWVDYSDPPDQFSQICIGSLAAHPSGSVLLWGDSYAANFHSGLDQQFGGINAVAEFTRDACAPILWEDDSSCAQGNRYILSMIKKHQPETVVLFADWRKYADAWGPESDIAKQLLNTLHVLNLSGVKRIILMGPAPGWLARLPDLILDEALADAPRYRIPNRSHSQLDVSVRVTDEEMKNLVGNIKNVQYFSTFQTLCNDDGCLVRTSDEPTSFTTFDYGHFTIDGASYVAKQLPLYDRVPAVYSR